MAPLVRRKSGLLVVRVPLGAVAVGASITTWGTTLKLEVAEYGPTLAPSCARARQ